MHQPVSPAVAMCRAMAAHPRSPAFPSAPASHVEDRKLAKELMSLVYGSWKGSSSKGGYSPKPLPPGEAAVVGGQSRYLWTDAFGVLNMCTEAARCAEAGDVGGRNDSLCAAFSLVQTTTSVLANPSSHDVRMSPSPLPPFTGQHGMTRYKGLRIGKRLASAVSDPGMVLDGMYFHHVFLWVFALTRLGAEFCSGSFLSENDKTRGAKILREAVSVVEDMHCLFVERSNTPGNTLIGVRWKINVDGTPIKGLPPTRLSTDVVSGAVAWTCLCVAVERNEIKMDFSHFSLLERYAEEMRVMAVQLHPGISLDPLGWGLQMFELQWLPSTPLSMCHPLAPGGFVESETTKREETFASHDVWFQFAETLRGSTHAPGGFSQTPDLAFRTYGAWLGARISGKRAIAEDAARAARDAARNELDAARGKNTDKEKPDGCVAVNRVMLAVALDPLAFYQRVNEPGVV